MDAFEGDHDVIADAALNFLSAGRDTTAQSLTWTSYSLMRHPSALASLREEIASTFLFHPATHQDAIEGNPSTEPLQQLRVADLQPIILPRTMAIFNESLRLHPPVPFEIKQCQVYTTLPDATFLPRESIIVWCIWAMNRSREIWGDDPDSFRPERWLSSPAATAASADDGHHHHEGSDNAVALIAKSPFEFPVFNAGPRSCLGKKMAELMACWVLVQMWSEFEFDEAPDLDDTAGAPRKEQEQEQEQEFERRGARKPRRSKNSLTLPMEGGLPCYVRLRDRSE